MPDRGSPVGWDVVDIDDGSALVEGNTGANRVLQLERSLFEDLQVRRLFGRRRKTVSGR